MNKFFKLLLVLTSLAPILLTYWFVEQVAQWDIECSVFENAQNNWCIGWPYILSTLLLVGLFLLIIHLAKSKLEVLRVQIEEIKTADNEILSFIIIYLLPLANGAIESFSIPILIFVTIFFFFIVLTTNSYHFNPLLNLVGYHFYETKVVGGITYIMLSKKNVTHSKAVKEVYQLTEYMILET